MVAKDKQFAINNGMEVVGSDGAKMGKIVESNTDHFVVQKGFFFPEDHYIPTSAITGVEADTVSLNVTADEAMSQNPSWSQPPAGAGTMTDDPDPFPHEQDSSRTHVNDDDNLRVDVAEEELSTTKRQVDRGDVNVRKNVVEEEREIDVPVTEERVNVSRRDVDREVTPGEDAFQEGTVEVPVHGEEVDVQKRARVTEEVDVDKEAVQGTEHVSDSVRHEEVTVDGEKVGEPSGKGKKKRR